MANSTNKELLDQLYPQKAIMFTFEATRIFSDTPKLDPFDKSFDSLDSARTYCANRCDQSYRWDIAITDREIISLIMDGCTYWFNVNTNILMDCDFKAVAKVELSRESNFDEYDYYIDFATDNVIQSEIADNASIETIAHRLTGLYSNFNN